MSAKSLYHVKCDFEGCKAKAKLPTSGRTTTPKGWVALFSRAVNVLASSVPEYHYCPKHGPVVTGKTTS